MYNEHVVGMPPLSKPPVGALLGLSVLATGAAEMVAYPLYLIKTTLQNDLRTLPRDGAQQGFWAAWEAAKRVYATRGLFGFYAGVGIAWLKSAPAACITYYVYETAKGKA